MAATRVISPTHARRLALTSQHLAGPPAGTDAAGILSLVRDLGCLQLDPVRVVARSHELVLWSRLGQYDLDELERLRWEERRLFEYWAHAASIVPTEDYPIHHLLMRTYPRGESAHRRRTREFLSANRALHRHVLTRLRARGPLRLRDFEGRVTSGWRSSGWTNERNVERMLDILQVTGVAVVAGRTGNEKVWDLADRWFPAWTPRERLTERQIVTVAAQRALRALGVATPKQIQRHFIAGRYPGLAGVLAALERQGRIERARIHEDGADWPGEWFVHSDDLALLDRLEKGEWEPRTSLLSPFDNLISDRARPERLFGFRYRLEIYVPKGQRQFGPYAMPILHGDRLIGQVDAAMDRRRSRFRVNTIHTVPDAPAGLRTGRAVAGAIESLARFLGADDVELAGLPIPVGWRRGFG